VLAAFGVTANSAAAFTTERMANPGPELVEYIRAQEAVSDRSGHPLSGYISFSDALTETGRADEIRIVGDCDGVYVGLGEPLAPWVPVEARNLSLEVELLPEAQHDGARLPAGLTPLVAFSGPRTTITLALERSAGGRHRFSLLDDRGDRILSSAWSRLPPGSDLRVNVEPDLQHGTYTIGVPGVAILPVPSTSIDRDREFFVFPNVVERAYPDDATMRERGYAVRSLPTPVPTLCKRLRDDATAEG
jgi:hypothetical protein